MEQGSGKGPNRLHGTLNTGVLMWGIGVGGGVPGAGLFDASVKETGRFGVGVVVLRAVVSDDFLNVPAVGFEEVDQFDRRVGMCLLSHVGHAEDEDHASEFIDRDHCGRGTLEGGSGRFEGVE